MQKQDKSFSIRWAAPKEPAGPIDGYEVAIIKTAEETSPTATAWTDRPPSIRDKEFSDLDEDTEYAVYVRAYNVDKNGIYLRSSASNLTIVTGLLAEQISDSCRSSDPDSLCLLSSRQFSSCKISSFFRFLWESVILESSLSRSRGGRHGRCSLRGLRQIQATESVS